MSGSPQILQYAAFTLDGSGGNPAGIVLDAAALSAERMLGIAADLGHSESAFVVDRPSDREVVLRYFSPLAEVAFCGHATIATAVALAEISGAGPYTFHTQAGTIAIDTRLGPDGTLLATLTSVPTSTRPATDEELASSLSALHWTPEQLDHRYPPHVAFGGVTHLVLAVRDRTRLASLDYDFPALAQIMATYDWTTLQLVWAESPTLFYARDPFPPGGVVEDPATGAAAAAFGGYLRDLGLAPAGAEITILQGVDNGTPSRLLVEPEFDTGRVRVTGSATPLSRSGSGARQLRC